MTVRRVVTGHTPDGRATVASDIEVDAITLQMLPGTEFYRLWGADEAPTFPDAGASPPGDTVVQNGTRHAWRNKGRKPCRLVFCLVGAHRR